MEIKNSRNDATTKLKLKVDFNYVTPAELNDLHRADSTLKPNR